MPRRPAAEGQGRLVGGDGGVPGGPALGGPADEARYGDACVPVAVDRRATAARVRGTGESPVAGSCSVARRARIRGRVRVSPPRRGPPLCRVDVLEPLAGARRLPRSLPPRPPRPDSRVHPGARQVVSRRTRSSTPVAIVASARRPRRGGRRPRRRRATRAPRDRRLRRPARSRRVTSSGSPVRRATSSRSRASRAQEGGFEVREESGPGMPESSHGRPPRPARCVTIGHGADLPRRRPDRDRIAPSRRHWPRPGPRRLRHVPGRARRDDAQPGAARRRPDDPRRRRPHPRPPRPLRAAAAPRARGLPRLDRVYRRDGRARTPRAARLSEAPGGVRETPGPPRAPRPGSRRRATRTATRARSTRWSSSQRRARRAPGGPDPEDLLRAAGPRSSSTSTSPSTPRTTST